MLTVGVDTGLRACGLGIADVRTGRIVHGSLVKNPEQTDTGADAWLAMAEAVRNAVQTIRTQELEGVSLLVVERQYIAGHPNPNQLIGLMCVVGAVLATVPAQQKLSVYPSQWKGSAGKDRKNRGTWAQLTDAERACIRGAELKTTGHNVMDAVGIARWALTKTGGRR